MIRVHTEAGLLASELAGVSPRLDKAIVKTTRNAGVALRKAVQAQAPRGRGAKAGRYRRSWRTEFRALPGLVTVTVGTDEPYGYRLEGGFQGDGFSQPPQPHVEPALAEVGPVFVAQVEMDVRFWLPDRASK